MKPQRNYVDDEIDYCPDCRLPTWDCVCDESEEDEDDLKDDPDPEQMAELDEDGGDY